MLFKKKSVRPPFLPPSRPPRRRASKVRRCTFCQRPATAAPARTPAPVSLWDPRAARSFASAHAPSEGNGDSRRSSAAGAAHRAPTSSSCSAPQKPHSPVPPDPCATPARTTLLPRRPRAPQRPPAASCAMHCTPLVQDLQGHAPHLPMPPRSRPLPHKLHTPQSAPGCVARTHTQWVAPRSWPGGRGGSGGPQRRVCGTRFRLATPLRHAHTHTTSQLTHGPPCAVHPPFLRGKHAIGQRVPIRASRCVCLLCTPPCSRQCTRPASSHGEAAPPTARHSHCTAACSSLPTARKQVARGRRGGP